MKMKKIFKYILIAGLTLGFTSCDKFFDNMEGDLSKVAAEDLLNSENGLLALLADLYGNLPGLSLSDNDKYQMFGAGARDLPAYANTVSGFWNYKAVRAVNVFLKAIEDCRAKGVLDNATADRYKGEALFIRAYYYFGSVRVYGGVPIVEEDLSGYYGTDEQDKLYVPRSTEKETWDWVIDQLEKAAELLPESQTQEMRANKYSAYALEARVALWAASVSKYWDRAALSSKYEAVQLKLSYMENSYASAYYQKAIDAAEDNDVIYVAEGNYLGNLDRGYIQCGKFADATHDMGKFISIYGGYSPDFSERNIIKYVTKLQPVDQKFSAPLFNLNARRPYNYSGPVGNVVIDGLVFDLGENNLYCAPKVDDPVTGTPNEGVLTGRFIEPGGSPSVQKVGYANGDEGCGEESCE